MELREQKVTVVGMGRTSLALVRLLLREGAKPFVTDDAEAHRLTGFRSELESLGVPHECGGHTREAFEGASLVIPSPGVPPSLNCIRSAQEDGATVMGEMEYAYSHCTAKIVAVTGTNGKTTTTELIKSMFERAGKSVALAGNNAVPLSQAVLPSPQPDYMVLEVSSYQLETTREFRPWIGVLLNVTSDHLERHDTLAAYGDVKAKLFANQGAGDYAILNLDDRIARATQVPPSVARVCFSLEQSLDGENPDVGTGFWTDGESVLFAREKICALNDVRLRGRHNLQNVMAALGVARSAGLDLDAAVEALRAFAGVEHRLERVATIDDVTYYNDSKSTNVESLRAALESFSDSGPLLLIAGGRGKGGGYEALKPLVDSRVGRMIVIGEDAGAMEKAFAGATVLERAQDLSSAVRRASESAEHGQVVLMSPGCASFDMFEDFEHRGRVFKEAVSRLKRGTPTNCGA